jgi:hypothetical protein
VILWSAMGADDSLPDDVTTLQAMLRAERAARLAAEAEAQAGTLLIEKLKLTTCRITPPSTFTNSCLEIGALSTSLTPLERNQPVVQNGLCWGPSPDAYIGVELTVKELWAPKNAQVGG